MNLRNGHTLYDTGGSTLDNVIHLFVYHGFLLLEEKTDYCLDSEDDTNIYREISPFTEYDFIDSTGHIYDENGEYLPERFIVFGE